MGRTASPLPPVARLVCRHLPLRLFRAPQAFPLRVLEALRLRALEPLPLRELCLLLMLPAAVVIQAAVAHQAPLGLIVWI